MSRYVLMALAFGLLSGAPTSANEPNEKMEQIVARAHLLIGDYKKQLFPHHDPFARVFDIEHGKLVFSRLKVREERDGNLSPSPLAKVLNAIADFHVNKGQINEALLGEVLRDAETVFAANKRLYKRHDRQSNLLALHYMLDYMRRFNIQVRRDGEGTEDQSVEEKKEEKKQDKKDKKDKKDKQKQPPEVPEMPKDYKPHTKDTEADKEKGSKDDQYVISEVNFETPYFGQRYFSEVVRGSTHAFSEIDLPTSFASPAKHRETGKEMIVRPYGKTKLSLFLPPLHKPYQPSDPRARIVRTASGAYTLELTEPLDEIRVPLEFGSAELMQPHVEEVYLRHVGFDQSEWPAAVRTDIFGRFSPSDDHRDRALTVSQAIANHIAGKYLYSVGARPETEPTAALAAGAFQCDMAAYAMVALLRDVYQIPSRVVGGFRAKKHKSGADRKSYLVLPGEGHAWVEVYAKGEWHMFDPTPIKKDKKDDKDDNDGEKDEFSDRPLDNALKPEPEEQNDQEQKEPGEGGEQSKDKNPQTHQERLKKDTAARLNETGANESTDNLKNEDAMDERELADKLELGSLSLIPASEKNGLLNRALRTLLNIVLDPNLDSDATQDHLNKMSSYYRGLSDDKARALFFDALDVHANTHPKLTSWIDQSVNLFSTRDLATSYREIYRAFRAVKLSASLIDENKGVVYPRELINTLSMVLADLDQLAHKNSKEIAIVNDFHRSLPAIVRSLLKQKYGLNTVGPNAATTEVAKLLQAGDLNDLRLLSILSPLTDFVLSSNPRPEYQQVRTWVRAAKTSGSDLLPLQRFGELARAVFLQPGKSIEANLRDETAFVATKRKRVMIPTGHGKEDAERITIVLYDTSGSMSGDPATFQAGLISAFTARALSDFSPSGKHRHKVVLVPFDHDVHTPVKVTNRQEALDVLNSYQSKLGNTGGGTDIQKAMLQALSLIADAEQRAGEPLAAANIVLMTDGESNVDIEELARARNAIDRETPLQTMFIAIGGTNKMLIDFATQSRGKLFDAGAYREFTHEHISDTLKEARTAIKAAEQNGAFYTEHDASAVSWKTRDLLDKAANLARVFSDEVYSNGRFEKPEHHLRQLETMRSSNTEHVDRPLEKWIKDVRMFAYNDAFADRTLLERVVDDLVRNMKILTGVEFSEFSTYEQEEIRHLLRFAAGLEQ